MTASASFPAIGTTAVVVVPDRADLLRARGLLITQLDELDRTCSRFRDDSELSQLKSGNSVSDLLTAYVGAALAVARDTDGLVDPTLGAQLRAAGYDRTFTLVEARDGWTFRPAPKRVAWREVELTDGRLHMPRGCELDLGATAKALAADRAAHAIADALQSPVLVSLGGDIATAGDHRWSVRVAEQLDGDGPCIAIRSGGIATSSVTARRWRTNRGLAHHLIDPRTGLPSHSCWRTATVVARTCLDANAAATAAIVLGDDAVSWLRERGLTARLVATDGGVVHVGGWPAEANAA
jgi:thiamine biosynthesis lipoprotein